MTQRAFLAKCRCDGGSCRCTMPDGRQFAVDLDDAIVTTAAGNQFSTVLSTAEFQAVRASGDYRIINSDDHSAGRERRSNSHPATHESNMSTIFEIIEASSLSDERKNALERDVRNCHANAKRLGVRVDAAGLVDSIELTEALKKKFPNAWQIEKRIQAKEAFVNAGVITTRTA
jgi:hypothetical protein